MAKKNQPHALIWVNHYGCATPYGHKWTNKLLRVLGVYNSKEEASQKKQEVMSQYESAGYGDVLDGDDSFDLEIRLVEDCALQQHDD